MQIFESKASVIIEFIYKIAKEKDKKYLKHFIADKN